MASSELPLPARKRLTGGRQWDILAPLTDRSKTQDLRVDPGD